MAAHTDEITITVYRGTDPVLITGDPAVIDAAVAAIRLALRDRATPRSRAALRLIEARRAESEERDAEGGDGGPEG